MKELGEPCMLGSGEGVTPPSDSDARLTRMNVSKNSYLELSMTGVSRFCWWYITYLMVNKWKSDMN